MLIEIIPFMLSKLTGNFWSGLVAGSFFTDPSSPNTLPCAEQYRPVSVAVRLFSRCEHFMYTASNSSGDFFTNRISYSAWLSRTMATFEVSKELTGTSIDLPAIFVLYVGSAGAHDISCESIPVAHTMHDDL